MLCSRYLPPVLGRRPPLVVVALLALLTSCDGEPAPPPPPEQRRSEPAPEPALDPELEPPAAWPAEVRDLREELDAFTTVDACAEALRERTPSAVAEALVDLGYDAFFDDLCRSLGAVKEGSEQACDAIAISTARAGCRRRLAIVHGRPDACPADRVVPGREPICVAWAARDPGLCRASDESALCRAVLAGEPACARLRDRERCRAYVQRYGSVLGDERAESSATGEPAIFTLTLGDGPPIERDVLERGVRVVPRGCASTVALADPLGEVSVPVGPIRAPRFHLELSIPAGREAPVALSLGPSEAVLSVSSPEHGALTSISGARGTVTVERLELRRGGAIAGTIEGTLRRGDGELPVRGRFATFIRDLEPLPPHCAAAE